MGPVLPPQLLLPPPQRPDFILITGGKGENSTIQSVDATKMKREFKDFWNHRIWAFTIDLYAILFIRKGITLALFQFTKFLYWQMPFQAKTKVFKFLPMFDILVFLAVFYSYFFLCGLVANGQTLGKKVLKFKVLNRNGNKELEPWESALRAYGSLIDFLTFGVITITMRLFKSKRTLADVFARTELVKVKVKIAQDNSSQKPIITKTAA